MPRTESGPKRSRRGVSSPVLAWIPEGYGEHIPPAHTAHAVECVWTSRSDHTHEVAVDPDGCVDVLIRFSSRRGAHASTTSVSVVGAMSHTARVSVNAGDVHIGVRLRPGHATSLLRTSVDTLTNRVCPLHRLTHLNAERLVDAIARIEHPDALAPALAALVAPSPCDPDAIQCAIDALVQAHGDLALSACSDIAHLGERQFRRACIARTGLSPKRLSRVLRFRHLATVLRQSPSTAMSLLAATHGYSDQAHMIRDVQQLSGRTPSALRGVTHV